MNDGAEKKDPGIKDLLDFSAVLGYFFRKRDPTRTTNINLKMMHGINKISIIMFLLGIIFLVSKYIVK